MGKLYDIVYRHIRFIEDSNDILPCNFGLRFEALRIRSINPVFGEFVIYCGMGDVGAGAGSWDRGAKAVGWLNSGSNGVLAAWVQVVFRYQDQTSFCRVRIRHR